MKLALLRKTWAAPSAPPTPSRRARGRAAALRRKRSCCAGLRPDALRWRCFARCKAPQRRSAPRPPATRPAARGLGRARTWARARPRPCVWPTPHPPTGSLLRGGAGARRVRAVDPRNGFCAVRRGAYAFASPPPDFGWTFSASMVESKCRRARKRKACAAQSAPRRVA